MRPVDFSVVMRPVGRMRMGRDVQLSLRITPLDDPSLPRGCWGWAVIEFDDGVEHIVVGGIQPSIEEAAVLGAQALTCERNARLVPGINAQIDGVIHGIR
jgi:hypothetical protein